MKVYSDNIVKPEELMNVIQYAFNEQNDFFVEELKKQIKPITILIWTTLIINIIHIGIFVYTLF